MEKKLARDILQWDVKNWSKPLQFWESRTDWDSVHACLELGANAGGISLWLALKGKTVVCSDVTANPLAPQLHDSYGPAGSITYAVIDAMEIPYRERFDLIVMKSVMGGVRTPSNVDIQQRVVDNIYRALKPGGKFLFAENLTASLLHQFFRHRCLGRNRTWRYVTVEEIRAHLSAYSSFELDTAGVAGTFGRTEGQRDVLATLDGLILERMCPKSWRYIIYGVATK